MLSTMTDTTPTAIGTTPLALPPPTGTTVVLASVPHDRNDMVYAISDAFLYVLKLVQDQLQPLKVFPLLQMTGNTAFTSITANQSNLFLGTSVGKVLTLTLNNVGIPKFKSLRSWCIHKPLTSITSLLIVASQNNVLLSAGTDGQLLLWTLLTDTCEILHRFYSHGDSPVQICLSKEFFFLSMDF
eukprot:TRINITY_DN2444_c0_g5_i2.p1 TRINITY_DN2444_c0_g5~~TRINITY_DN2444_c0_g5_i2.p1  ORF type:complete len:185 (-),score=35.25 TRINITY_DN2444_c0_g5_i2:54-608(-)